MSPAHLQQIEEQLRSQHIRVDPDWLSECIEYFVDDAPTIGLAALLEKTLEQWRLSDLADIGLACLPAAVEAEDATTLDGQFVVQMLFVIDVSESAYDQLRQLYNKQLELTNDEKQERKINVPKRKRALKLRLTDGHRSCSALEYRPIACLHTKLAPGCKMRIGGPGLRCRNGVLLLEPHNVRLLGGEVAKYEVDNAFENVLLRQLGRPLNPKPRTDYSEQRVVEEARNAHNLEALREQHRLTQLHKSTVAANATQAANARNQSVDMFGAHDDDDLLAGVNLDDEFAEDFDRSAAANVRLPQPRPLSGGTIELSDDDGDFMDAIASIPDEAIEATPPPPPQTLPRHRQQPEYDEQGEELHRYEDFANFEDECALEEANAAMPARRRTPTPPPPPPPPSILDPKYPFRIQGCNLVTIAQLQRHRATAVLRSANVTVQFIIKAEVHSVFEKLQVRATGWRIGVLVTDASGAQMRLRLGDAVLNALTNTSAEELHQMRRQVKERPQVLETITEILARLKQTLETLQCFFKLPRDGESAADGDEVDGVPMIAEMVRSAPVLERILANKLASEAE